MKNPKCAYCGSPPGDGHTCKNCGSANPDIDKIQNLAAICFQQAFNNAKNQGAVQKCLAGIKQAAAQGKFDTQVSVGNFTDEEFSCKAQRAVASHLEAMGFNAYSRTNSCGMFSSKWEVVFDIEIPHP